MHIPVFFFSLKYISHPPPPSSPLHSHKINIFLFASNKNFFSNADLSVSLPPSSPHHRQSSVEPKREGEGSWSKKALKSTKV